MKQILGEVFPKISKTHDFGDIVAKIRATKMFSQNLTLSLLYAAPTSCKKARKSLEPFLRKVWPKYHASDFIGPSRTKVEGPKSKAILVISGK